MIDWRRMASLAGGDGTARSPTRWCRRGSPVAATRTSCRLRPGRRRADLAQAGYPGGAGFPATILMTGGARLDQIVAEVKRELGITLQAETLGDGYFDRLAVDAPQMWALSWVADYPGRNDFLGVLLNSGASNNYGHWSSPEFDAAILEATSASDAAAASAAYDKAERRVRDQVPVVPLVYGPAGPSRTGLLGAQNGLDRPMAGSHGPTDRGSHGRRAAVPGLSRSPQPLARDVRDADRRFDVRDRHRLPAADHHRRPIGRARDPADRRRCDRPDGFRGVGAVRLVGNADLHAVTSGNDHMIPNTSIVAVAGDLRGRTDRDRRRARAAGRL